MAPVSRMARVVQSTFASIRTNLLATGLSRLIPYGLLGSIFYGCGDVAANGRGRAVAGAAWEQTLELVHAD